MDLTELNGYLVVGASNQIILLQLEEDENGIPLLKEVNNSNYNVLITSLIQKDGKIYAIDLVKGLTVL